MTDRQMLEAVLAEVRGLGTRMDKFESRMDKFESQMDRMEESQKRFEEETGNNFADIRAPGSDYRYYYIGQPTPLYSDFSFNLW